MGVKLHKGSTSHLPMLIRAVQMTKGPVLELGAGLCSTPVLHWLCSESRRPLLTLDDDPYWRDWAGKFASRNHRTALVEDWDAYDLLAFAGGWSVVLIDHRPLRRVTEALRLYDHAEYLVIHDTSKRGSDYNWHELWPKLPNYYHWQGATPWTTVASSMHSLAPFVSPGREEAIG